MQSSILSPVCIASPLRRSGTTLLQRLLCSASNTLIYGESCANDLHFFSNFVANKETVFNPSKDWRNNQLQSVLKGDVNNWIPDLMPDIDGYLDAFKGSLFHLLNYYADFAQQQNRPVWGMKMPEWNPINLQLIQRLLPEAKIIYLHRNLEDCVRSAKKIDMVRGEDELRRFCLTWKQYADYAKLHLSGANVMHLSYENLVDSPIEMISKIEIFSGAQNIDPTVMNVKVNTYDDDPKLEDKETSYLQPSELSETELEIIATYAEKITTAATV